MWEKQPRRRLSSLVRVMGCRAPVEMELWDRQVHAGVKSPTDGTEMSMQILSSKRPPHKKRNVQKFEHLMAEYRKMRLQRRQSN